MESDDDDGGDDGLEMYRMLGKLLLHTETDADRTIGCEKATDLETQVKATSSCTSILETIF
jgi:hypothetical protein